MMDVLCIGLIVADIVAQPVKEFPEKGKLVLVDNIELHNGGCATNTGITLARLGVKTGVMGKVGEDGFGRFLLEVMKREGIDVSGVRKDETSHTSATCVLVDPDGERRFIHYIGANGKFSLSDIDWEVVEEYKLVHVAGACIMPSLDGEPLGKLMERLKKMEKTTSLDTAWDATGEWLPRIESALPYVDYFIPSLEEARELSRRVAPEDIADFFHEKGVKNVVLKMGEKGSFISTPDFKMTIPAFKVKAVDATGAGDAFAGGFLKGILEGWPLEKSVKFANAVGAFCVQAIGATQGIKGTREVLQFIEERESQGSK